MKANECANTKKIHISKCMKVKPKLSLRAHTGICGIGAKGKVTTVKLFRKKKKMPLE